MITEPTRSFNTSFRPQQPLTRVSFRHKCPICKHHDWCSFNDGIAICMRVRSDKPSRNGGWTHRLREFNFPEIPETPLPAPKPKPVLTSSTLDKYHRIYSRFLFECVTLKVEHRSALLARGLSAELINRSGYASTGWTLFRDDIERRMHPDSLEGVPGFYREGERWQIVAAVPGFFIPVRNSYGRIRALLIRRDGITGSGKYIWFSSASKADGTSSGAPVHFAKPELIDTASEIIITEGALKADVIAHLSDSPVVGIGGVSNFGADFSSNLRKRFPQLSNISIAYDKDLLQKEQVYAALLKLISQLERERFRVRIRTWAGSAKGYDDFLLEQTRKGRAA